MLRHLRQGREEGADWLDEPSGFSRTRPRSCGGRRDAQRCHGTSPHASTPDSQTVTKWGLRADLSVRGRLSLRALGARGALPCTPGTLGQEAGCLQVPAEHARWRSQRRCWEGWALQEGSAPPRWSRLGRISPTVSRPPFRSTVHVCWGSPGTAASMSSACAGGRGAPARLAVAGPAFRASSTRRNSRGP